MKGAAAGRRLCTGFRRATAAVPAVCGTRRDSRVDRAEHMDSYQQIRAAERISEGVAPNWRRKVRLK